MKNVITVIVIMIIIIFTIIILTHKENYTNTIPNTINEIKNILYTTPLNFLSFRNGKLSNHQIIPSGTIVMWYGTYIPQGWVLCNGQTLSDGTKIPDLQDKFIKGSDISSLNTTGGSKTYQMTERQMPNHNHVGTCSVPPKNTSGVFKDRDHVHNTNENTSESGAHTHTVKKCHPNYNWDRADGSHQELNPLYHSGPGKTTHFLTNLTGTGSNNPNHSHQQIYSNPGGEHTHDVGSNSPVMFSKTNNNTTTNEPINNEPEYFVLAFIMKL